MRKKKFSIIIPVKPGGKVKALDSLRSVDYPAEAVEIIVAEGKCPSRQRNSAAAAAGGELLYFLDDDSIVSSDCLERAASHLVDAVAVAGGPSLTPESDTPLQHAFGLALSSVFGGGSVSSRYKQSGTLRETGDNELILCNLAMRSDVFREFGGFDERLYPNEENELMVRIRKQGWRLLHDPALAVRRSQRCTLRAFIRQLFGYGRGRGRQTLIGGISGCAAFVPPLFLIYLLSLPFLHDPVYYLPLLCYFITAAFSAIYGCSRAGKTNLAPIVWCLYAVLHLAYGSGILWELLTYPVRKTEKPAGEVVLRRVKEFGNPTFNAD